MQLIPNAAQVLRRAWSVRLMLLAGLLIVLEPVFDVLLSVSGDWAPSLRIALSVATGLISLGAVAARIVAQRGISDADQ